MTSDVLNIRNPLELQYLQFRLHAVSILNCMSITHHNSESGIDHKVQRLYIHWDITSRCNYDCVYCYAKKDYEDDWMKTDDWIKQVLVATAIKHSTLPVFLGLLGGEPTLHPRFQELARLCLSTCHHPDSRLYITTNGSNTNAIKHLPTDQRIKILMSLHSSQEHKDPNFAKFLTTLKYASSNFVTRVNLMLDPNYLDRSLEMYHKIKSLGYDIQLHPHFIYESQCDQGRLTDYDMEILNVVKDADPEYLYNNEPLNDYEIFSRNLNRFKGWLCWNNNYEITWDGRVQHLCKKTEVLLTKDPMFFKRISKVEPMTCPYEHCVCDGLLKTLKVQDVRN